MGVSDARVERYKIYNFDPDGTFTMDSIKQRYSGNWEIEGDRVIMNFNSKAVAVFKKNMDPNDLVTTYVSEDKVVELGERTAVIENDLLNFGSEESNAVHFEVLFNVTVLICQISGRLDSPYSNFMIERCSCRTCNLTKTSP